MNISSIKKISANRLLDIWVDFKGKMLSKKQTSVTYDDFIYFINDYGNQSKYKIVAYKWHRSETELERDNPGCTALCVFNLFQAFSGEGRMQVVDDDGMVVKFLVKKGPSIYEFPDQAVQQSSGIAGTI